jgi:methyl-accepting chemotaxis protein
MEPSAASSAPGTAHGRPAPTPAPDDPRPPKRRVRNYLLDTGLQLRLASYLVAVATLLSLGLGWLLWSAYRETSRVVALGDPDVGESLAAALAAEDRARIAFVAIVLAVILVCLLGAAVIVTHRIAGPAYVLRNACGRIAEGDLSRPRPLRSHDLLVDLADAVSAMVDALRGREQVEREAVARAAAVLRDPGATADARAAAAAELERLAAEKEARLAS